MLRRGWVLILCFIVTFAETTDSYDEYSANEPDHSEWLDPNDPLAHLPPIHQAPTQLSQSTCSTPDPSDSTLKLVIRSLFTQLHVDAAQHSGFYRRVAARLTDYDVSIIEDFLTSEHPDSILRDKVRTSLSDMLEIIDYGLDSPSRLQMFMLSIEPWVMPLVTIQAVLTIIYVLVKLVPKVNLIRLLLFSLFVISLFTSYNRMYQEQMARRLEMSFQDRDACRPQGLLERSVGYLTGLVTIQKKSDCLKFIEAQTVSVIFEISPIDVLFDVVGNGLFSMMEHFATRLNRATVNLYAGLPLQLQLLITIAIALAFIIIFMFGVFPHSVSFFGFRIQPERAQGPGLISQLGSAIGHAVEAIDPTIRTPPAHIAAPENAAPLALQNLDNVTPRTKKRSERIFIDRLQKTPEHQQRHRHFITDSPVRRSRSTPRLISIPPAQY